MPAESERGRPCRVALFLRGGAEGATVPTFVQRSTLLASSRSTIDVTPFGTAWRQYRVGRRVLLYRLVLGPELGWPSGDSAAGGAVYVTCTAVEAQGAPRSGVGRVAGVNEDGTVAVDIVYEDTRQFS